ncbi:MAG: hypothetical protein N2259_00215 [Patescibacteria group bacterium]|nr:hypothetical protein [Patescibacteria group bacterium]
MPTKKLQPTSYQLILKKSYKILGLSLAIFALSLIFVFWRIKFWLPETRHENKNQLKISPLSQGFSVNHITSTSSSPDLWQFPAPEKFSVFRYPETKKINLTGRCQDDYYAILIFNQQDDYRRDPTLAKFNKAFPCQRGQKIKKEIDLTSLSLSAGQYYYFIADQGETGSWYNPR